MKIGLFDSGVGGLTIWKEVVELLPYQSTIYIADSKNAPYGIRSTEEIIDLSIANTERLISKGCNLIVVACNTATTQAIAALRKKFDIPFVGIEPAVKPAASNSKTKVIGVLATQGTIESEHFNRTKEIYSEGVQVITQVGDGLVKLIESGKLHSREMDVLLRIHVNKLLEYPIDHLVLGCTHYPLLKPILKKLLNPTVKVVDSGFPVASQVKRLVGKINSHDLNRASSHEIITSGDFPVIKEIVKRELNKSDLNISYSSLYQSE